MSLWSRMWGTKPASEERSLWVRTDGDLTVNDPNQLVWLGSDTLPGLLAGPLTEAHRLPAVVRATSLIVSPLTAAPFKLIEDATGAQLPTPRWVADPHLLRPDGRTGIQGLPHARRLTRSGFWREIVRSAIWYGVGAFIFAVDGQGAPQAGTLRQIHPGSLSVSPDGRWVLGASTAGQIEFDHEGRLRLGPVEYRIAVMRNPLSPADNEGGLPLGVFGLTPAAFKSAAAVERYITGTFSSGVPSGYLKSTTPGLDQSKADHLKERWMAAHGGVERSVAVLPHTVDYTPISYKPVDAEATQIFRLSVGQVAMAFGLPPEVMGVSLANSMTYQNIGDAWTRLKAFGLRTWIDELDEVVSSLVPFGQSIHVDLTEFENVTTPDREPAEQQTPDTGGQEQ